jgi:hypothetical protein
MNVKARNAAKAIIKKTVMCWRRGILKALMRRSVERILIDDFLLGVNRG